MKIENDFVYGIFPSVKASKYPMSVDTSDCNDAITQTVKSLGSAKLGSGHDNYLNGIIVQFDLTCSIKMWTEAERYHFLDFVSSQSTMHRIAQLEPNAQCNEYVLPDLIVILRRLIQRYNSNPTPENYLAILYNVPVGYELTARMTTNYRQLKTIYHQRKNHRLPEWREFCKWIEKLPYFEELCLNGGTNHDGE